MMKKEYDIQLNKIQKKDNTAEVEEFALETAKIEIANKEVEEYFTSRIKADKAKPAKKPKKSKHKDEVTPEVFHSNIEVKVMVEKTDDPKYEGFFI